VIRYKKNIFVFCVTVISSFITSHTFIGLNIHILSYFNSVYSFIRILSLSLSLCLGHFMFMSARFILSSWALRVLFSHSIRKANPVISYEPCYIAAGPRQHNDSWF
jgi:hypothetical protein